MSKRASFGSLRVAFMTVLAVLVTGTFGYMIIEGYSFLDALYTTVSIMTTEGIFTRQSGVGEVFSIILMLLGVASILYTFTVVMEYVLEGHLSLAIRMRIMSNKTAALRNHAIICGFGRVGSQIAEDLAKAGTPFVVIDERESSVQECIERGYLAVSGDATSDKVLSEAGVCNAGSVLVATDNDAHNISITLSARHLSKTVYIVARANQVETEVKLKLAGANSTLSPYTIGGHRMAHLAMEPSHDG